MKLDYGTQLGYADISLGIGHIKKPLLKDIDDISFELFSLYEHLLNLTPDLYYEGLSTISDGCSDEMFDNIPDILKHDPRLADNFLDIFRFFFRERVIFADGMFVILKENAPDKMEDITEKDVCGVIAKKNYLEVVNVLKQVCCIYSEVDDEPEEKLKFKNGLAKRLYEKMQKAKKKEKKKFDPNYSLPNIISSVACMHPSINMTNIWKLTIFQLYDAFSRLQTNEIYNITRRSVSVWGDEKKKFDYGLWHKNIYDK